MSQNKTIAVEIGGVSFILQHLLDFVPYVTFYIAGIVIGILGK